MENKKSEKLELAESAKIQRRLAEKRGEHERELNSAQVDTEERFRGMILAGLVRFVNIGNNTEQAKYNVKEILEELIKEIF